MIPPAAGPPVPIFLCHSHLMLPLPTTWISLARGTLGVGTQKLEQPAPCPPQYMPGTWWWWTSSRISVEYRLLRRVRLHFLLHWSTGLPSRGEGHGLCAAHKSKPQAVTAIAAKVSLLDATSEGWTTFPFGADRLVCPALRFQRLNTLKKNAVFTELAARPACS